LDSSFLYSIEGVLSLSWIQVFFILIEGFRTRRALWSTNNLLGVAFNEF